jgi:hypothetical protein
VHVCEGWVCHVTGLACPRVSRASVPRPCSSRPRSATVSEVGAIDNDISIHRIIANCHRAMVVISCSLFYLTPVSRLQITYRKQVDIEILTVYLLETDCFSLRWEIKKTKTKATT